MISGGGTAAADPSAPVPVAHAFETAVRDLARSYAPDASLSGPRPDEVLRPLREAGLVGRSFDGTFDYFYWVQPRRPLSFLGNPVELVITEEKRGAFIGCCVDDGVTLVLRAGGDRAALQQFADDLHCRLGPALNDSRSATALERSRPKVNAAELIALECHFGDINS
ncbi:MAG: hypothetical protein NBV68_09950 [Erythrobacter sp.]|uniref:hypothetical protein n=1 Tax=Erythrobacter sp. TaxID=1042 RepID=UPI0025FAD0FC|nr:hypothetical protein [Erythrobacter sp.]MCL9999696.1 hypothetical protein [Erythrobacter sp.]